MRARRLLVIFGAIGWAQAAKAAPTPKTIASGQEAVSQIAVDDANVYWISTAGLFRAPRAGGSPSRLWDGKVAALAVDATAIYFGGLDGLWALPKAGGRPVELEKETRVIDLALDSANVYISSGTHGSVLRVSKQGGATATLAQIPSAGIGDVEVDDRFVYFTVLRPTGQGGAIMRVPKKGGPVATVYDGDRVDGKIAVGSDDVYFGKSGDEKHGYRNGQLLRVDKRPGAAAPAVLASDVAVPVGVALGDGFLYAIAMGPVTAEMEKGRVVRVPIAGGRLEILADGQREPYVLAFHNGDLFWATMLDQTVRSLPVPPPEPPASCAGTAIDLDAVALGTSCDVPADAQPRPPADGQLVLRLEPARVTVAPGQSAEVAVVVENVTDGSRAFSWNTHLRSELRDGHGQRIDERFRRCGVAAVFGSSWTPRRLDLAPKGRATAHLSVAAEVRSYDCDYNETVSPLRRGAYKLLVTTPLGYARGVLIVR
jgi:hypothetical protein